MDEQVWFGSCEDVDTFFREGRIFFNDTYVKKLAQVSAWFSRVPSGTWPMNSGTQQQGFRFGRGFYDPCVPKWRKIVSERCSQTSCDDAPYKVRRPGSDTYFWELLRLELETDWICVEDLVYRLLPAEEIMQFEASNALIVRSVHEEFSRSSYIGASGHKWLALVDENNEYCGETDDAGWIVPENAENDPSLGGFNLCEIRVKCAVADLTRISFLGLDLLDDALVDLGDEDDAYRVDMRENGFPVLDIIVPEPKVARRMYFQAKEQNGYWMTDTDFDKNLTQLKLGVNRIIGDYAFGYDGNAPRYNADAAFNATLPPFDPNDPDTWPKLIRVPRYIEIPSELGYSYIPNTEYHKSDFGISVCFVENAMKKWNHPNSTGYGSARMEDQNYSGDFEWRRPDWECNRRGKMGFFQAQFRLGMQVKDPTIMHTFLHRLDHGKRLTTSVCPINTTYVAPTKIDQYVCQGIAG